MWIPLVYRDVDLNRYEISDEGKIRKVDGTILAGCNPANEKGYFRIGLVTKDGKMKKYGLHRLILAGFTGDSELEVDHVDGNKLNNALSNLEYVTGDENKRRAAANGLYKSCENHPFASLTNEQVHLVIPSGCSPLLRNPRLPMCHIYTDQYRENDHGIVHEECEQGKTERFLLSFIDTELNMLI